MLEQSCRLEPFLKFVRLTCHLDPAEPAFCPGKSKAIITTDVRQLCRQDFRKEPSPISVHDARDIRFSVATFAEQIRNPLQVRNAIQI